MAQPEIVSDVAQPDDTQTRLTRQDVLRIIEENDGPEWGYHRPCS